MTFQPTDKTTKIPAIGTTAIRKPISGIDSKSRQIRIQAKAIDVVVKWGDSTVVADNTYTADELEVGNVVLQAGVVEVFNVPTNITHISAICEDGSSTGGTVWANSGYGE